MSVNRIQIKASLGEKQITIPIGQTFDEVGREQLIRDYEVVEQQDNVNIIQDYETPRFLLVVVPLFIMNLSFILVELILINLNH